MFKSIISGLFRFVSILGVAALVSLGVVLKMSPTPPQSAFTHDEVAKINPVMIIDKYTMSDEDHFKDWDSEVLSRLINAGVVFTSPTALEFNPNLYGYALPIIIQSGGGMVKLGIKISHSVNILKQRTGLKITCYVGEAQSMAFYLMVTMCDKVISKRSARLMQHRTSYSSSGTTPSTYQTDNELSRKESQALGVKYDEWHNLVRGPEDHVFNLLEIEKYKLVDEWMD